MHEAIFHIGHQKTGTTYLQNYFFPNLNIDYLGKMNQHDLFTRKSSFSHNLIKLGNELLFNNIDLSQETKIFINDYFGNSKKKKLISKEGLIGDYRVNYFNGFATLHKIKKSFMNPKIIFIFREQVTWGESIYQQAISDYSFYSPYKFLNFENNSMDYLVKADANLHQNIADWYTLINYLYELFGESNVLALPYEIFKNNKINFYSKILKFLNIKQDLNLLLNKIESDEKNNIKVNNQIINKRINHGEVLARCFINKFYRTQKQPFPFLIRKFIDPKKSARFINSYFIRKKYPYQFPENLKKRIQLSYKESNQKLESLLKINLKSLGYFC